MSGGQIITWIKDQFVLQDTIMGSQCLSCVPSQKSDGMLLLLTSMYGPLHRSDQTVLWSDLDSVRSKWGLIPWLVGGDFNVTLLSDDRRGGRGG